MRFTADRSTSHDDRSVQRVLTGIVLAALLSRVVLVLAVPLRGETFTDEPGLVALSLAGGKGFANPYRIETGETAHVAPLMPLLLAAGIKVFGSADAAWLASRLLAAAAIAIYAALLPALARRLGFDVRAGIIAATLAAVPAFLWIETNGKFETPYVLLVTTVLVSVTTGWLTADVRRPRRAWMQLGLAWGCGLLVTPSLLPVGLAILVAALFMRRPDCDRLIPPGGAVLMLAAMIAVPLPYSIDRSIRVGGPVLVRSNFGLEFFVSNNDAAHARLQDNTADPAGLPALHPNASLAEAERVRAMGEGAYHAARLRDAQRWIDGHPGRFARLTLSRFREFWLPTSNALLKTAYLWCVSVVALAWLGWRARPRGRAHANAARLLLTALVAYSLLHYLLQADVRYRYPINGLLLLAFGAATIDVVAATRRKLSEVRRRATR